MFKKQVFIQTTIILEGKKIAGNLVYPFLSEKNFYLGM